MLQRLLRLTLFGFLALLAPFAAVVSADEGWVIRAFDVVYQVNQDGSIDVVEDLHVDFGSQQKHGIFRDLIVRQRYDAQHDRRYTITVRGVDDGQNRIPYQTSRVGAALQLKIGDPDKLISGAQRYRITYRLAGALNQQPDWDELFWNVTGQTWPVTIERVSVTVKAPGVQRLECYEGPTGSRASCRGEIVAGEARFTNSQVLRESQGLTIVVALAKGAVSVPPPDLERLKTPAEQIRDFVGLKPLPLALAGLLGVAALGLVARYWWLAGRDRWFGDVHYLTEARDERRRPLFARDTVVVEYQPPELKQRRLRPAQIGTLLDERADTLDVSATIVDLAVRGYLRIVEIPKQGIFGDEDYRLERLKPADSELLAYERLLFDSLFEQGDEVTMSSLEDKFYDELAEVKTALYKQVVGADRFFASNPETVRLVHLIAGAVLLAVGVFAFILLGSALGAAVIAAPIPLAGLALVVLSRAMPRRTAPGREMFRRCLGFRRYLTVAETERQRFAEEANIFEKYLPYAMVMGCVDKWAQAFEGMEGQPAAQTSGWYVSSHPFTALAFSHSIASFSSSMSSAITSTPGGSGSSGFGGGGSSGGGGGGGGGGSW